MTQTTPRPTPLTDANLVLFSVNANPIPLPREIVLADFARRLERDRAELMGSLKTCADGLQERCDALDFMSDEHAAALRIARALLARLAEPDASGKG